jgi:glycosyltransferase involved in cell wall biosynthesis
MRILAVAHQFPPDFQTGTEMLCLRTMQALRARGCATLVLTADPSRHLSQAPRRAHVDGIETVFIPTADRLSGDVASRLEFYRFGRNAAVLASEAGRWRPDIIHIHHVAQFGLRAVGRLAEIAPVIFTATDFHLICPYSTALLADGGNCRGPDEFDANCLEHHRLRPQHHGLRAPGLAARLKDLARRLYESPRDPRVLGAIAETRFERIAAFSAATLVIAGSELMRAMFLSAGARRENLILVPHEAPPVELPERSSETPLTLGFHGTLTAHKGAHVLVAALRSIPPHLQFSAIIQGDMKGDPGYVARLRDLAGADRRIEFRPSVPYDEYGQSLAGLDVLIIPSIWAENRPLTLLSGLESGRYIVGSRVPGIEAALTDPASGCLVPPDDPEALAALLTDLLSDPTPVFEARKRRTPPTKFLAYVDALEGHYRRVLGEVPPPG